MTWRINPKGYTYKSVNGRYYHVPLRHAGSIFVVFVGYYAGTESWRRADPL